MAQHEAGPSIVDIIADAVVRKIEEKEHIEALAQAVVAYMEEQDREAKASRGETAEFQGSVVPAPEVVVDTAGTAAASGPKATRRRRPADEEDQSKAAKPGKAQQGGKKGT